MLLKNSGKLSKAAPVDEAAWLTCAAIADWVANFLAVRCGFKVEYANTLASKPPSFPVRVRIVWWTVERRIFYFYLQCGSGRTSVLAFRYSPGDDWRQSTIVRLCSGIASHR